MVPPLTLCAYMKKGPNLRWSLIQCSGGDEGDRTPDLLTASQALSQLSYAPVRRSTIRELPRRCKDNFGKYSAARGTGTRPKRHTMPEIARGACPAGGRRCRRPPIRLHSGRPRDPRHETGPYTTFGRHPSNAPELAKLKPQVDGLRLSRNEGYGRGVWVKSSKYPGFVMAVFRGAYPRCSGPCLTPIQEDDSKQIHNVYTRETYIYAQINCG